jgi:hypothetical protein
MSSGVCHAGAGNLPMATHLPQARAPGCSGVEGKDAAGAAMAAGPGAGDSGPGGRGGACRARHAAAIRWSARGDSGGSVSCCHPSCCQRARELYMPSLGFPHAHAHPRGNVPRSARESTRNCTPWRAGWNSCSPRSWTRCPCSTCPRSNRFRQRMPTLFRRPCITRSRVPARLRERPQASTSRTSWCTQPFNMYLNVHAFTVYYGNTGRWRVPPFAPSAMHFLLPCQCFQASGTFTSTQPGPPPSWLALIVMHAMGCRLEGGCRNQHACVRAFMYAWHRHASTQEQR